MMPPKCYTWLESCGSQLSDGKNEKLFFCILQSVGFSMTLRTDIFLYTEKLSYDKSVLPVSHSDLTLIKLKWKRVKNLFAASPGHQKSCKTRFSSESRPMPKYTQDEMLPFPPS